MSDDDTLRLFGEDIPPGTTRIVEMPVPSFSAHLPATLPVRVMRGAEPGPRIFLTGTLHGDEVIGIDVFARLIASGALDRLVRGDVIMIPVVNIFGYVQHSRYMPDRRDLNRSFPGEAHGSLASRLAHQLFNEILVKCTHGIDFHSGPMGRFNLPQLRLDWDDAEARKLAMAFHPPLILHGGQPEGSLRDACGKHGVRVLLFEGSEARRFDDEAAEIGWRGIVNVLNALGMISGDPVPTPYQDPVIAKASKWQRAPESGVFRSAVKVGQRVGQGQVIGSLTDFFGMATTDIISLHDGIVIGQTLVPTVNEGEALFHIALTGDSELTQSDTNWEK